MIQENDYQLIQRTLTGDLQAASQLSERHRKVALSVAYQALGNADDAQDVAQEALVYTLQRLASLQDFNKFVAWLRQVTLTLCAEYRRRRGTRRLGTPITVLNEATEEAHYAESLHVRQVVAHLPEAQRTTLLLRYVGGWSLEEVASLLSIPVNTVRSRLMTAKRSLRHDLETFTTTRNPMRTKVSLLSEMHTRLIEATFPKARLLQADANPEAWMPFSLRVRLELAGGEEKTVDFREDLTPEKAEMIRTLHRLGIPGPNLLSEPVSSEKEGFLTLCDVPQGENLLHWTLGGTPHRVRLATERAFESIDRLQTVTERLINEPIGATLARRTLADEAAIIRQNGGEWLEDTWFATALECVEKAVAEIHDPLVFTDYTHFFPNFVRIYPTTAPTDTPLGWPGDTRFEDNAISEYVAPFGYLGDPLLGLAMVWIYDCYPFVHTGFVEQYLWRRNVSRRDFAPRLGLKALQVIQRELSVTRPEEGASYWDALHGYVDEALASM